MKIIGIAVRRDRILKGVELVPITDEDDYDRDRNFPGFCTSPGPHDDCYRLFLEELEPGNTPSERVQAERTAWTRLGWRVLPLITDRKLT
jgi:hypothetical protein